MTQLLKLSQTFKITINNMLNNLVENVHLQTPEMLEEVLQAGA
jgi:hypothetical protein